MLSEAKHLVANLEMRPDNDAARLLLRVSQDVRKYRDRPFAEFTLNETNVLRVTLCDCSNGQRLCFTIEPCLRFRKMFQLISIGDQDERFFDQVV